MSKENEVKKALPPVSFRPTERNLLIWEAFKEVGGSTAMINELMYMEAWQLIFKKNTEVGTRLQATLREFDEK